MHSRSKIVNQADRQSLIKELEGKCGTWEEKLNANIKLIPETSCKISRKHKIIRNIFLIKFSTANFL